MSSHLRLVSVPLATPRPEKVRMAAVILAAGKGTRMHSSLPKVLHPLLGRPMLAFCLDAVASLKPEQIVVVVGFGADAVRAAFKDSPLPITFVVQDEQLGTGHATKIAAEALEGFDGDVLILPGDAPMIGADTLSSFNIFHSRQDEALSLLTTQLPDAAHYGRIVRDQEGRVERIVEAKDASEEIRQIREINTGVYLVRTSFLKSALSRLKNENMQKEYYLTDIVEFAREDGFHPFALRWPESDELLGINDRLELCLTEDRMASDLRRGLMKAGVTLCQPETSRIELAAAVARDVLINAGTQLLGTTRVGAGSVLGGQVILQTTTLGVAVQVGHRTVLRGCSIEDKSRIEEGVTLVNCRVLSGARVTMGTVAEGAIFAPG